MNVSLFIKHSPFGVPSSYLDKAGLASYLEETYSVRADYDVKYGLKVVNDAKWMWECVLGSRLVWAVAELRDNRYQAPRYYEELEEALDDVLK